MCVRACGSARAFADISKRDADIRTYMYGHMHAYRHSYGLRLILLEATDAPISVRVSFVIRENVNQSPGPRRLLLLRASSFLLHSLRKRISACVCVVRCACGYVRLTVLSPIRAHVCVVRV